MMDIDRLGVVITDFIFYITRLFIGRRVNCLTLNNDDKPDPAINGKSAPAHLQTGRSWLKPYHFCSEISVRV